MPLLVMSLLITAASFAYRIVTTYCTEITVFIVITASNGGISSSGCSSSNNRFSSSGGEAQC